MNTTHWIGIILERFTLKKEKKKKIKVFIVTDVQGYLQVHNCGVKDLKKTVNIKQRGK